MINPPKLIGHRGVRNLSPENTLDSIKLAKHLGLKWVEIDVKISNDLIPILLHDDTLDRTTNGKGFPIHYDYKNLKKLDAGLFFYKQSTEIYIPSLEEVLLFCLENNMGLNIELKPNLGFEEKNVDAISKVLKILNFNNEYYFSSFDWNSIILMKRLMPNDHYGLLIDKFNENVSLKNILDFCQQNKISCCGFNKNLINSEIINILRNNNLIITVYSDDNLKPTEAIDLWSRGVTSIFTDDPSDFKVF